MNHDEPASAPSRATDRLLAFSDGVVAIAATLLVLPLVEIVPRQEVADIGGLLRENSTTFLAFVLSFVVIYRFWLLHRRIFSQAVEVTPALGWLNGLWLLSVVFVPFTTQLIGTQDTRDRLVWSLYIGTLLVTAATSAASLWLVRRDGGPDHDPGGAVRILVMTGAMAVAFVLAATVPGAGPWALLLLIPAGAAQRLRPQWTISRRRRGH